MRSVQELYHMVFDNDQNIKACGRDVCKEFLAALHTETGESFGDEATGMMHVDKIRRYFADKKDA